MVWYSFNQNFIEHQLYAKHCSRSSGHISVASITKYVKRASAIEQHKGWGEWLAAFIMVG